MAHAYSQAVVYQGAYGQRSQGTSLAKMIAIKAAGIPSLEVAASRVAEVRLLIGI